MLGSASTRLHTLLLAECLPLTPPNHANAGHVTQVALARLAAEAGALAADASRAPLLRACALVALTTCFDGSPDARPPELCGVGPVEAAIGVIAAADTTQHGAMTVAARDCVLAHVRAASGEVAGAVVAQLCRAVSGSLPYARNPRALPRHVVECAVTLADVAARVPAAAAEPVRRLVLELVPRPMGHPECTREVLKHLVNPAVFPEEGHRGALLAALLAAWGEGAAPFGAAGGVTAPAPHNDGPDTRTTPPEAADDTACAAGAEAPQQWQPADARLPAAALTAAALLSGRFPLFPHAHLRASVWRVAYRLLVARDEMAGKLGLHLLRSCQERLFESEPPAPLLSAPEFARAAQRWEALCVLLEALQEFSAHLVSDAWGKAQAALFFAPLPLPAAPAWAAASPRARLVAGLALSFSAAWQATALLRGLTHINRGVRRCVLSATLALDVEKMEPPLTPSLVTHTILPALDGAGVFKGNETTNAGPDLALFLLHCLRAIATQDARAAEAQAAAAAGPPGRPALQLLLRQLVATLVHKVRTPSTLVSALAALSPPPATLPAPGALLGEREVAAMARGLLRGATLSSMSRPSLRSSVQSLVVLVTRCGCLPFTRAAASLTRAPPSPPWQLLLHRRPDPPHPHRVARRAACFRRRRGRRLPRPPALLVGNRRGVAARSAASGSVHPRATACGGGGCL